MSNNKTHSGGFDFLGAVILAFIAVQLYFFVGFLCISLGEWL